MAIDPIVLLVVLLILSVVIAFGIGGNDEALAPLVGSGAVKMKYVLILGIVVNILGAVILGGAVSETIGAGLLDTVGPPLLSDAAVQNLFLAVIISTSIFLILSSTKGLPVSTTVSVVGSVIGVGLYYLIRFGNDIVKWGGFTGVLLGWVISPILGLLFSIGIYWIIRRYILTIPKGLKGIEKMEKYFLIALIVMVIIVSFSRAGNDVGNAVGVLYGFRDTVPLPADWILLLIGGTGIGVGLFLLGRKVLKNVGKGIIEMRPSDGFAVQTSVMIIILTATILGFPISGTVVLIFAIIGNSMVKHIRFNKKTIKEIIISWGLTVPVTLLVAMGICVLLFAVNP
ncbi:MAG: inorganic phosphate transporter [Candidatus Helarchaeota archaeon]|nr:inorganic phosphate transporter [Candidatus Helarchaeota archaeon]